MLKDITFNRHYILNKLREKKHRITFRKKYRPMQEAIDRFKKCDSGSKKPSAQIRKEINLCKKYWGCYPLHYFRYNLYRKDRSLSEAELLNYVPEFFFYELFLPWHNPKQYKILLADKIITEQFFRSLSIPQPHTICKLINSDIYSEELDKINFKVIAQKINDINCSKIFAKPADGHGGHGIYIFKKDAKGQYKTKDNDIFDEDFLNIVGSKNNYIIQSGIDQDPEMSRLYPHSVNTFRILTENKKGTVRIVDPVFFRVGRSGAEVDNFDQGGLLLTINVDTGTMSDHAISSHGEHLKSHPDTEILFKGRKVSKWKEIKASIMKFATKLPQFTYIGWDISLSKNGPTVLEANAGTGLDGLQLLSGGLRIVFKIDDPTYYWKNKVKRI